MSYTITRADGTTLVELADGRIDDTTTSLTLVGRNKDGYGEYLNNNLVKLLTNFASATINPPKNPLLGQVWYDRTAKRLKVFDGGFRTLSGAILSSTRPTNANSGDLWYDTINNQLKILNASTSITIGPTFPSTIGENGWTLPATSIKDITLTSRNLTLIKNYGKTVGVISSDPFETNSVDSATYFGTSTFSMVAGVNVIGDINYTGKINQKYISLSLDIDRICPGRPAIDNVNEFTTQTNAIISILNATYPINTTVNEINNPFNSSSVEKGVPVGSEARVVTSFTLPYTGVQVRRFVAKSSPTVSWDYYDLTGGTFNTLTNVVATFQGAL
jgi:hypothetical protein